MRHLLHLLFNFLLMSGTLFAAGGGMSSFGGDGGGGDASGGDGAGAASGADGSSDGTADGANAPEGDGESGEGIPQNTSGGDDAGEDPNATVDLGDGRQVPAKFKKLMEAAKGLGLEKEVKQLYFSSQRLAQKFPGGVNEAIQLADAIEAHGGLDSIGQLKTDIEAFHADAELFAKDPAKWVEGSFAENAEQSLKAFTHAMGLVSEQHPEQYDHLMAKVIISDLDQSPIHDVWSALSALKDSPEAQALAKKLADYYNSRKNVAAKVPEKKVDAERQKLEADRKNLQSEQETLRNHTVNSQTIPHLGRQMSTQLEKEAKAVGFDLKKFAADQPKAWQAMRGDILKAVMEKASADATFVRNYRAVLKEGNTQRAAEMMNKKHEAILSDIVRDVAKGYGILRKGAGKPGVNGKPNARPTGQGGGTAMLRVSAKPPSGEIDWAKTGNKIYDSQACLKTGKWVMWG